MYPIHLTGRDVLLREFTNNDLPEVSALVGDDRVTSWLSFDSRTPQQANAMLRGIVERAQSEPRTEYYLAVCQANEPDTVIGFARLGLNGTNAAKLGYAIHADHWGRGYATDATRTLIDFGFERLQLHRISAAIGPSNASSLAVIHNLGFGYEGTIRDHVWTNGAWRDSQLYSVLTHEWQTPTRAIAQTSSGTAT